MAPSVQNTFNKPTVQFPVAAMDGCVVMSSTGQHTFPDYLVPDFRYF